MTRAQWYVLRFLAFHLPWTWRHVVSWGTRAEWARIAAAQAAGSLHVAQWADHGQPPIPAWVPCRACGGTPCAWTDHVQERLDRYV